MPEQPTEAARQAARAMREARHQIVPASPSRIDELYAEHLDTFAAAQVAAAVAAERERIADMIAAAHDENLRQGSSRVYGLMAVLDMLNLKDEPTTKGHGDE